MTDDDLTIAYQLGVEDMRSRLHKHADEIERLRLELDMVQATILVPSQKDDRRTIERLRAENERLREALKNVLDDSFGQRAAFTNVRSISVGTLVAVREALGETE